tara:strand:- start:55 stop:528 length:474 start_codon:yes stop_codon:yes gene_type:complete
MKMWDEIAEWQSRNFPDAGYMEPLLGMFEEIGEFYGAKTPADFVDAAGDFCIYAFHFAKMRNLNVGFTMFNHPGRVNDNTLIKLMGKLAHHTLKDFQGIRIEEDHHAQSQFALQKIICYMHCDTMDRTGGSLTDCTEEAWNVIRERDWQKNKVDGVS